MAGLPVRVLRRLVQRGHAMLVCELEQEFPGAKRPGAVAHAIESLKMAKCIAWTTQGWMPTDAGRNYVRINARLIFQRGAA